MKFLCFSLVVLSVSASSRHGVNLGDACADQDVEFCKYAKNEPSVCQEKIFMEKCPITCNACCLDDTDDLGIVLDDQQEVHSCMEAKVDAQLCADEHVKEHCPATCGLCACRDNGMKFENSRGSFVSCWQAKQKPIKCRNNLFKDNCPVTCGTCLDSDTSSISNSCEIVVALKFPDPSTASYYGYKNDIMRISKEGESGNCAWDNRETEWGCKHEGDAYLWKTGPEYYDESSAESAVISNVSNGHYTMDITNYSNTQLETYYNGEGKKNKSTLTIISPTGTERKFEVDGELSIHVDCNDTCECTIVKQTL